MNVKQNLLVWLNVVVLGLLATSAHAHHSFASFDQKKLIDIDGFVAAWQFGNPHSHILVQVPSAGAKPSARWDVEANSVNIMKRQGWTKHTLKPGDRVHLLAHPARDGSDRASLFYLQKVDGSRLYTDITR